MVALCDARDAKHRTAVKVLETFRPRSSPSATQCHGSVLRSASPEPAAPASRAARRPPNPALASGARRRGTGPPFWTGSMKDSDHDPDRADACLAVLSGRDEHLKVLDLRLRVSHDLAPPERDAHSPGLSLYAHRSRNATRLSSVWLLPQLHSDWHEERRPNCLRLRVEPHQVIGAGVGHRPHSDPRVGRSASPASHTQMRPSWPYNRTMKAINVTELKNHLSRYLRLASRGRRIVVRDRDEPIAEIGPPRPDAAAWHDRLAGQGRLRPRHTTLDVAANLETPPRRGRPGRAARRPRGSR